jgi:hypothetical protein
MSSSNRTENLTIVKTRKDFQNVFRSVFIPSCVERGYTFNFGYALNNWTMFFIHNEDGTSIVVELIEDEKSK